MKIKEFYTGGVLVLANFTQIRNYFTDNAFDDRYPEGLAEVIRRGYLHIITTESNVGNLNFTYDSADVSDKLKPKEAYNYLQVGAEDKICLMSHPDFTMISRDWGTPDGGEEDQTMLKNMNEIFAGKGEEFTMEEIVKTRNDRAERIEQRCPQIPLKSGKNLISIYAGKARQGGMSIPTFTFLFEIVDALENDKISLEPISFS